MYGILLNKEKNMTQLIKNNKKNSDSDLNKVQDVAVQSANALALATARMKENRVTGALYIVSVEDPRSKSKVAYYITLSMNEDSGVLLSFKGLQLTKQQLDAINSLESFTTLEDVVNYVREGQPVQLVDKRVPWTRVIDIDNITYKAKNGVKNDS